MTKKRTMQFTLKLSGVNDLTANLEDQLFEAGCDDALLHCYCGRIFLDFDRDAVPF